MAAKREATPFQKFEDALRKVLSAPKSEVDKRIKEQKKAEKPKD